MRRRLPYCLNALLNCGILVLAVCMVSGLAVQAAPPDEHGVELFEKQIRPLFAEKCQVCHGSTQQMGGLNIETAEGFRKGADSGPLVSTNQPSRSKLLAAVSYQQTIKMPPTGKLSDLELAALEKWVELGAPWPVAEMVSAGRSEPQSSFWSFQPVRPVAPPAVRKQEWVRTEVDHFILAKLEEAGLQPTPPADKLTLLRRATLDLTGLPPTLKEIEDFLGDNSADAFEKVVERLLASPRYGERWGRRWLDVARYADSTGADEDNRYPYAWRYRDYVINAFNIDKPYDRFVQEQIAGDLLRPDDPDARVNVEGIIATGFLALGSRLIAEVDKPKLFYDVVDEQIDTTSKAFLGVTLACARCHDHKFDPFPTTDYYAMASIFASTKQFEALVGPTVVSKLYFRPLVPDDEVERYEKSQKKIEAKNAGIADVEKTEARRYRDERTPLLAKYMLAAYEVYALGDSAENVAGRDSLELDVLKRWAEYLKPERERRPQLEDWYAATDANRADTARQYQDSFLATIQLRDDAEKAWEMEAAVARAKGDPEPEKPKFFAGDDRFFTEVNAESGPFGLPKDQRDLFYTAESKQSLENLKAELANLKAAAPNPPLACAVNEGERVEQAVLIRGNVHNPGELVPKRFPLVLAGREQEPIQTGSGRLELARWLGSAENPLTARVMANRIWQWHFGEGLTRTPNNFGQLGERPTHPELLDYLAARFVQSGWSIKSMHRLIMLSNSYRMSAVATPQHLEKDPENRLWSRFETRRMEVEELRDSLLALDGSLDLSMGGSLMEGQGGDKEFSEDRKGLHPDSTKRRTVYLPIRRSNLPTLFNLFDFGDAGASNPQRSETNVAPQALFMMNSDFVAERAGALAAMLLADPSLDDAARVRRVHLLALNQPATAERIDLALSYLSGFPSAEGNAGETGRMTAWTSYCRALIASNDFLFVQ